MGVVEKWTLQGNTKKHMYLTDKKYILFWTLPCNEMNIQSAHSLPIEKAFNNRGEEKQCYLWWENYPPLSSQSFFLSL